MDVAAFSGDNFDPKEWINKALRSSDPSQAKEEAAASLVNGDHLCRSNH